MKWIDVKERLPKIVKYGDDSINCVLVYQKDGFECGSDIQVWNTMYLHNNKCKFTHWMPLPQAPVIK